MPLTYKDWSERTPGHGTELALEWVMEKILEEAKETWTNNYRSSDQPFLWDFYFLETDHRCSMYINTNGESAGDLGGLMAKLLHQKDFDRVDLEIFGRSHLIVTIPDTQRTGFNS